MKAVASNAIQHVIHALGRIILIALVVKHHELFLMESVVIRIVKNALLPMQMTVLNVTMIIYLIQLVWKNVLIIQSTNKTINTITRTKRK